MLIISSIVQMNMNKTYSKYSKIASFCGLTGADVARKILKDNNIDYVEVKNISGHLTDHFNPLTKVIGLSNSVYNSTSIAAIGVAAHEAGHAVQYHENYFPMKIRSAIVGITSFSSKLLYIVIILSFVMHIPSLVNIALLCFFVIFIFQLITLPVEFNASKRALKVIDSAEFNSEDKAGVKSVLSAAAMTYVAAALTALAQMVAFFLRTNRRN